MTAVMVKNRFQSDNLTLPQDPVVVSLVMPNASIEVNNKHILVVIVFLKIFKMVLGRSTDYLGGLSLLIFAVSHRLLCTYAMLVCHD